MGRAEEGGWVDSSNMQVHKVVMVMDEENIFIVTEALSDLELWGAHGVL